jgi:tetratricopeptide (TPR) repeat protein
MEGMVMESTGESELATRLALALLYVVTGRYRECLAIVGGVAADDPHWRLSRWIAAEAYRMLGEPYWDRSLEAAADAIASDDPRVNGWGRFNRAKVLDKRGQYRNARREYELAKRTASNEPMSDFERFDMHAWCDWGLGWLQIHRAAANHALRTFRRALSNGLQGDYGIVVWLIHGLATVLQLQGSYDEARILYRQCLRLCDAIKNRHYTAWMYLGLAEAACQQGGWAPGGALAGQAREIFEAGDSEAPPSRDSAAALELFCDAAGGRTSWSECRQGIGELPAFEGSYYLIERLSVRFLHAEAVRQSGAALEAAAEFQDIREAAEQRNLRLLAAHAVLGVGAARIDIGTDRSRSNARWELERVLPVFEAGHLAWATANCLLLMRATDGKANPQRYEERLRRVTTGCLPIEAAAIDVPPGRWRPVLAFVSE